MPKHRIRFLGVVGVMVTVGLLLVLAVQVGSTAGSTGASGASSGSAVKGAVSIHLWGPGLGPRNPGRGRFELDGVISDRGRFVDDREGEPGRGVRTSSARRERSGSASATSGSGESPRERRRTPGCVGGEQGGICRPATRDPSRSSWKEPSRSSHLTRRTKLAFYVGRIKARGGATGDELALRRRRFARGGRRGQSLRLGQTFNGITSPSPPSGLDGQLFGRERRVDVADHHHGRKRREVVRPCPRRATGWLASPNRQGELRRARRPDEDAPAYGQVAPMTIGASGPALAAVLVESFGDVAITQ